MVMTDDEPSFVDTNILVYASIVASPFHEDSSRILKALWAAGAELWTSRQVLREYLATLSRPQTYRSPLTASELVADVDHFQSRFQIAEDGPAVTAELLRLIEQTPVGGRRIHDANIVATMRCHGIRNLLTYNVADFARFAAIIAVIRPGSIP